MIELVTEPDLRTPEEARLFMQKLRQIYLGLGISDCSMEEGSLRCDGNVSLRRRGATAFGTKTELKNMNSFKNLHDGLAYDLCRQAEVLEEGGVIYQETRHWDPSAKRTIVMRVKETADDYRLFPEPDWRPTTCPTSSSKGCRRSCRSCPTRRPRVSPPTSGSLPMMRAIWWSTAPQPTSSMSAWRSHRESRGRRQQVRQTARESHHQRRGRVAERPRGTLLADTPLTAARALSLVKMLADDTISSKQAKEVFAAIMDEDKDPEAIVEAAA